MIRAILLYTVLFLKILVATSRKLLTATSNCKKSLSEGRALIGAPAEDRALIGAPEAGRALIGAPAGDRALIGAPAAFRALIF